MTATAPRGELVRFNATERACHWATTVLMVTLAVTGLILYVGELAAVVGRRDVVRAIHVWSGLALAAPLTVSLVGRRGRELRADLVRLGRWLPGDGDWLRHQRPRRSQASGPPVPGKFNAGQKLVAIAFAGLGLVMLATGGVLGWPSPFPDAWRTGATFTHDVGAFALWALIVAHGLRGLGDPVLLRAMLRGRVSADWARRHRPGWVAELDGPIGSSGPGDRPLASSAHRAAAQPTPDEPAQEEPWTSASE